MNSQIEEAKKLMEQGWQAREALNFVKAKKLLTKAKNIFIENSDWYNVTECLNHLAYLDKLKSTKIISHAINLVEKSGKLANKYKTKNSSILRAKISLYNASGNFEEALLVAQQLLGQMDKPANKADVLQHIALFQLRTGQLQLSQSSISSAEENLLLGWEQERDPHRSIWKVAILLTKALVLYNLHDVTQAINVCNEAKKIAIDQNLKARLVQAETMLQFFKNSLKNKSIL